MMHAVLVSLYGAVGAVCPMEPLVDMDDVCSRHLNWGRVMKVLKVAYAVDWTEDSDHKALVVGGSARPTRAAQLPHMGALRVEHVRAWGSDACAATARSHRAIAAGARATRSGPAASRAFARAAAAFSAAVAACSRARPFLAPSSGLASLAGAAALVDLFDAVRSRTGEGYEALRAEALLHQASIDAAVAAGGCTGAGMRAKLWFQSFDGDRVMMWVVTLQQGMGVYACIMVRCAEQHVRVPACSRGAHRTAPQSSLLSVFVPQLCPDPAPLHVCTLHDNCAPMRRAAGAIRGR